MKLKDIIKEIAASEPATNPSYQEVKVGDQYVSRDVHRFGDHLWVYFSTVLEVGPIEKRFGKDDRVVTVKIQTFDLQKGEITNTVDEKKRIWVSQLLKGLV